MEISLAVILTTTVALCSVISPMLTAIINNIFQMKLKKIELKQQEYERTVMYKRNIFENFLKGLSMVAQRHDVESIKLFSEYYPLAYMYLPEPVQKTLAQLNLDVASEQYQEVLKYVDLITIDISTELAILENRKL